jgi:lauroyl/myristoyl acyltransferase
MTGLDRPAPESSYSPKFFGHPSRLPVFYTRLAMKTRVPVIVVAVRDEPDGTHMIDCSEMIWMEPRSDPREEIIYNTERVLTVAEKFISAHPEQWSMFFPVWPDLLEETNIAKS